LRVFVPDIFGLAGNVEVMLLDKLDGIDTGVEVSVDPEDISAPNAN
jgi:hypothetical protein